MSDKCVANLIPEQGVIHLQNALSEEYQKALWEKTKPYIKDPHGFGAGFSGFEVSKGKSKRNKYFDEFGEMLFRLAAEELMKQMSAEDCDKEPSQKRLASIISGKQPVSLNEIIGNYYRSDATLFNHCDCDNILFTMSVALGENAEFTIGKRQRHTRMNERQGPPKSIIMKSGDVVFFDGGSIPHEVKKIITGTAPVWWEENKVPNGARCVVLFREDLKYIQKIK